MDDFEFPDSYDYSAYVEAFENDYEGNGIGQDMSEYEGDLTPSEGDFSDIFDPGDEIVHFEEDEEPREDSGCP